MEPFVWNMPDALQLAKDTGANVGVILDAWHWHHSGSTVADIAAAGAERIVHVHVSDAKAMPPEDVRERMLGADLVVVAGGNTANMLAVWRTHGFDTLVREAWEAGATLAGYRADARMEGGITFGMNAIVVSGVESTLRVGQRVQARFGFA